MTAAITPLLSSKAVTTALLADKDQPLPWLRAASRFASRMFDYEQFWNLSPRHMASPPLAAAPLSTDPAALLKASGDYSGIFPCFLGGLLSVLFWSISRAPMILRRVSRGSITSSIKPREAVT